MPLSAGIYYASSGGGHISSPPVVLIHGAGASHLVWPAELRRLPGFQVLTLDLPGHGKSAGVGQNTIAAYSKALMEFISSLEIYEAVLVGHSMGGAIALQAAIDSPERVKALGMIGCAASFPLPADFTSRLLNPVLRLDALAWIEKQLFGPDISSAPVERVNKALRAVRPTVLAGDWQACAAFDARKALPGLAMPVWLAAGLEDRLVPTGLVRSVAGELKNARLQHFSRAGHMLMLEQPRAAAGGLVDFLRQLK